MLLIYTQKNMQLCDCGCKVAFFYKCTQIKSYKARLNRTKLPIWVIFR